MKNSLKIRGRVRLQCHKKDGTLKWDTGFVSNTVMNLGYAEIAKVIGTVPTLVFNHLAVGTSTLAVTSAQTALSAELSAAGLERNSGVVSRVTSALTDDTHRVVRTWTAVSAETVEEVGMFNAISGNIMLGRQLTTSKAVAAGETLTGTYDIIVG